ncbi:MAG: hypothetical protein FWC89_00240 [Defluviitaleaceae bacterium]|nr:hypothetical protein [Defluviitaleaceae bacterium]
MHISERLVNEVRALSQSDYAEFLSLMEGLERERYIKSVFMGRVERLLNEIKSLSATDYAEFLNLVDLLENRKPDND